MAERAEVAQRVLHAAIVVEDDLAHGGDSRQGIADRDHGHLLGDRLPAAAGWTDRQHDEAVDAAIREAPGEVQLALRFPVGVGHQRAEIRAVQLALHGPHQLLVPEVGQAPRQQPHDAGGPAAQGTGDRVGLVAQLGGRRADSLLRLGRDVHTSQRVAHRCRRQSGLLGQLPDRRATFLSLRHLASGYPTGRSPLADAICTGSRASATAYPLRAPEHARLESHAPGAHNGQAA